MVQPGVVTIPRSFMFVAADVRSCEDVARKEESKLRRVVHPSLVFEVEVKSKKVWHVATLLHHSSLLRCCSQNHTCNCFKALRLKSTKRVLMRVCVGNRMETKMMELYNDTVDH